MFNVTSDPALRASCLHYLLQQLELGRSLSRAVLQRLRQDHAMQDIAVYLPFLPATATLSYAEALSEEVLRSPSPGIHIEQEVFGHVVSKQKQFLALELFLANWGDPYLQRLAGCRRAADQDVLLMLDSGFSCAQLSSGVGAWFTVPVANAFVIRGDLSTTGYSEKKSLDLNELNRLARLTSIILVLAFDGDGFIRFDLGGKASHG